MSLRNYIGFLGAILIMAGTFSAMLHLPLIGNWNYWDLDTRLASVVVGFAVSGFISSLFKKPGVLRICGWGVIVMLLLTFIAVYFKVHSSFSFIPLKKLASAAAGLVSYRWQGWMVQAAGAVLMILEGKKERGPVAIEVV